MPPSQSENTVTENEGNGGEAADQGGSVGDASVQDRTPATNEPGVLRGGTGGTGERPVITLASLGQGLTMAANDPRVLRLLRGTRGRDGDPPGGTGGTGQGPVITMADAGRYDIIMGGTGGNGGSS
ncbi:hypothetical protein B0H16DRAFT_1901815 [Mycena metata]|uniref:Uncharacterized protein n=1 Tax=Mycena metata TaxID=1033252 RepID=A0AAD7GUL9_9AGAR|nr:hypothetical protein B0H16DRAFT_1901815 [Mycena metata]